MNCTKKEFEKSKPYQARNSCTNFSNFVSGGENVYVNKSCLPYYTQVHGGWLEVTFEFCVQKCKESDLCTYANWNKHIDFPNLDIGHCQLSRKDCYIKETVPDTLERLWEKSKFLKNLHYSNEYSQLLKSLK